MPATEPSRSAWIGVDWGTTRLRAWLLAPDGKVIARGESDRGMGHLEPREFENALLEVVSLWLSDSLRTDVIICGMAGARQGWREAPYRETPCEPMRSGTQVPVEALDCRLKVWIVPGLCQRNPPDVMRGEETQVAGLLYSNPDLEGPVCLPGTHSKWVHIGRGRIETFRTFLTGEMFALLAEKSILRHSVSADDWDEGDFTLAVKEAAANPASIMGRLFELRAGPLLGNQIATSTKSRLSALLIGAELAASQEFWQGKEVQIIGGEVAATYGKALEVLGCRTVIKDAERLTLAGLAMACGRNLENPN